MEDFLKNGFWRLPAPQDSQEYLKFHDTQTNMVRGDRIALFRPETKHNDNSIIVLALGIIQHPEEDLIKVDWIRTNMLRKVRTRTCKEMCNGPFTDGREGSDVDSWLGKVFRL
jgi:hypothetical protein